MPTISGSQAIRTDTRDQSSACVERQPRTSGSSAHCEHDGPASRQGVRSSPPGMQCHIVATIWASGRRGSSRPHRSLKIAARLRQWQPCRRCCVSIVLCVFGHRGRSPYHQLQARVAASTDSLVPVLIIVRRSRRGSVASPIHTPSPKVNVAGEGVQGVGQTAFAPQLGTAAQTLAV
jgi:hypothetical protein